MRSPPRESVPAAGDSARTARRPRRDGASTTSYGDYDVLAEVRGRGGLNTAATSLSRALRETYGPNPSAEIATAIKDIEAN